MYFPNQSDNYVGEKQKAKAENNISDRICCLHDSRIRKKNKYKFCDP